MKKKNPIRKLAAVLATVMCLTSVNLPYLNSKVYGQTEQTAQENTAMEETSQETVTEGVEETVAENLLDAFEEESSQEDMLEESKGELLPDESMEAALENQEEILGEISRQYEDSDVEETTTAPTQEVKKEEEFQWFIGTYVNPEYADVITEEDLLLEEFTSGIAETYDLAVCETEEEAVAYGRRNLVARNVTFGIPFYYSGSKEEVMAEALKLYREAGEVHTGISDEGDYVHWNMEGANYGVQAIPIGYDSYYVYSFLYTVTYYTTYEQEQQVTERLATIMGSMNLDQMNDYGKIRTIYDYICENVTYDYDNLYDNSYTLKYSAYAALMNQTAVCQGYATLLYRMLLEAGVDVRVIAGTGAGGPHAWNIIHLDNVYYNVDATWDAGDTPDSYLYFLKAEKNFGGHVRGSDYTTSAFNSRYPMTTVSYTNGDQEEQLGEFVTRLYQTILERKPDSTGLNIWVKRLMFGEKTGASAAQNFVFSNEFKNKNVSDERYVDIIYQALMGRKADDSGKAIWMERLDNGVSRTYVFKKFVDSGEFKKICESYGIETGTIELTENRDMNYEITSYVSRTYKVVLGRKADVSGLNNWTGMMIAKNSGGANIVANFMKSKEFTNRKLDNSTIVEIAYKVMMGRASDASGKVAWKNRMDSGVSTTYLVNGFAKSSEFAGICKEYGIAVGTIVLTENRDQNIKVTQFVTRCYNKALGRSGDLEGINNWCGKLNKKTNTPEQVAHSFIFSKEVTNKNLNNTEYINMLYRVCMGREADTEGRNAWLGRMDGGMTKETVFSRFAVSKEFEKIVASYGL